MMQLATWRHMWSAAVGPLSSQMRVTKWGLLIAALMMGVVTALVSKSVLTGITVACTPLSLLAICYWAKFVTGAALFNRPDQACLVPLLNDRVRHTAVLAWLLTRLE